MAVKDWWSRVVGFGKKFMGPRNAGQGAPILPTGHDAILGIPDWTDAVTQHNRNGYQLIRTQMGTAFPIHKLGKRLAALDLVAVGDANSERRKAYQYILDKSVAMSELIESIVWGFVEGVNFTHLKPKASPSGGPVFIVPDFTDSLIRKEAAGGPVKWDGRKIYRVRQTNPHVANTDQIQATLNRSDYMVFKPGASSNPQGDPFFGLVLLNLAEELAENRQNTNAYRKRHGKVYHTFEKNLERAQVGQRSNILQTTIDRLWRETPDGEALTRAEMSKVPSNDDNAIKQFFGIPMGDVFKLMEPGGQTWKFLLDDRREIRAEAHLYVLGQLLTSDSRESGASGSSMVQLASEDMFLSGYAQAVARPMNGDMKDWIDTRNTMPPLAEGEEEIFFEFRSRGRRPEDLAELGKDFNEVADDIDSVDGARGHSAGGSTEGNADGTPDF